MRRHLYVFFFLAAVCSLLYAGSLSHDFLMDDFLVLFGPQGVLNRSLTGLFSRIQVNFYRPVGHLILWFSGRLFGTFAPAYHALNILLFTVICFLFFVLVRRWTGNEKLALLTALFYAAHPVNAMLVQYITANIISTFVISLQIGFLCFMTFADKKSRPALTGSLAAFLAGLFSHEMAVVFPLFLICYLFFIKGWQGRRIFLTVWPFLAAAVVYGWWRWHFFSLRYAVEGTGTVLTAPGVYLATLSDLLVWYVSRLFYPVGILFLWSMDLARFYILPTVAGLIGLSAAAGWLIFGKWRRGIKPFALSVFLIGLLPAALASFTYSPTVKPLIEPHWFYFSSIGFFLLAAVYILSLRRHLGRLVWALLILLVIGSQVFLLQRQSRHWADQESYCRYWLSLNRGNLTPYYWLGKSLLKKGHYDQAVRVFRDGIRTTTIYNAKILADMGYAELMRGREKDALHYFKQVFKMDPHYAPAYYYMARYYAGTGQPRLARLAIRKAVHLYQNNPVYEAFARRVKAD